MLWWYWEGINSVFISNQSLRCDHSTHASISHLMDYLATELLNIIKHVVCRILLPNPSDETSVGYRRWKLNLANLELNGCPRSFLNRLCNKIGKNQLVNAEGATCRWLCEAGDLFISTYSWIGLVCVVKLKHELTDQSNCSLRFHLNNQICLR